MANKQLKDNGASVHTSGTFTSILRKEADSVSKITNICGKASEIAKEIMLAVTVSGIMINTAYAGQFPNAKEKHSSDYAKNTTHSNMLAMVEAKPKAAAYRLGTNAVSVKNTHWKSRYVLQMLAEEKSYPEAAFQSDAKLSPKSTIRFSILKPDNPPNYYGNISGYGYSGLSAANANLFPLPMNVQNATVAYFTYVIKHKGFKLYSEQSPSGQLAITLSKGNHGALGVYFSLNF
jgi:hypothetical protein